MNSYRAFISYSHTDSRTAEWLQRSIEGYRVPRRFVGRETKQGVVPARLGSIFRDRMDLEASADLPRALTEALEHSEWLLVLCSPASARSPWVDLEVRTHRALHGADHAICVIVAGDPSAAADATESACFPPSLRPVDGADTSEGHSPPAAVDIRPDRDGRRIAVTRIVAALTGISPTELADRDARRRIRNATLIALFSVVGMALTTALALLAASARNEAIRQRTRTEQLVEFMLGDLREELQSVGKLELLDSVGTRVISHYAQEPSADASAEELGNRGRALHLIGDVELQRSQLDRATRAFVLAEHATARALADSPSVPARVFDHAQSRYWLGYVAWLRHDPNETRRHWESYLALAHQLVRLDARNPKWQLEVAYAEQNLGNLALDQGSADDALRRFMSSRRILADLVKKDSSLAIELANVIGWIAKAHEPAHDYSAALRAQLEKLAVLTAIPTKGRNLQVEQLIANGTHERARLLLRLGDFRAAMAALEDADARFDELTSSDSENRDWLAQSSLVKLDLAVALANVGNLTGAREVVREVGARCAPLFSSRLTRSGRHIRLRGTWVLLHTILLPDEDARADIARLNAFMSDVSTFASAPRLGKLDTEFVTARTRLRLADILDRNGDPAAARDVLHSIVDGRKWTTGSDDIDFGLVIAEAYRRLGLDSDARDTLRSIRRWAPEYVDARPGWLLLSADLDRVGSINLHKEHMQ